jgi:hypothetical protein
MPSLLIIRLHPIEPVTGNEFINYLNGLSITAHDLSFIDPAGAATPALGPATYIAPQASDSDSVVQMRSQVKTGTFNRIPKLKQT